MDLSTISQYSVQNTVQCTVSLNSVRKNCTVSLYCVFSHCTVHINTALCTVSLYNDTNMVQFTVLMYNLQSNCTVLSALFQWCFPSVIYFTVKEFCPREMFLMNHVTNIKCLNSLSHFWFYTWMNQINIAVTSSINLAIL